MKKYVYILKSELLSNFQYLSNIVIGSIGYLIHIFVFMNLWLYLYEDETKLINGYSLNQMIWYVIITEIVWSAVSNRKLQRTITNDVKGGNIVYNLNKPYNYVLYALFNHLGQVIIKFLVCSLTGFSLGVAFLHRIPNVDVLSIGIVLVSMILAIIINIFLIIAISLLAFFIEDAAPFHWLYTKLILIVGTLFPIEFFPKVMQPFINLSPIYVVSYGPARLFVNFNYAEAFKIIIFQVIYVFLAYFICLLVYRKGVRRLNVNGG